MINYEVDLCAPGGSPEGTILVTANSLDFPPSGAICFTTKEKSAITGQMSQNMVIAIAAGRWSQIRPASVNATLGSTA